MKKRALVLAGLIASTSAFGAAYKIPEQSTRSMGTAAAYFASADAADAAYYNPACMSWLGDKNNILIETGAKYIYLPRIKFNGNWYSYPADAQTTKEYFLIPYLHLVSKDLGKFRWGLSIVTPYGLSKRWSSFPQIASAKEFTLGVIETNLTIAYEINEKFSVGAGFRVGYATGKIKLNYPTFYDLKMKGNSALTPGYLLSVSYKLTENLNLSSIYRSKISYKIEGEITGTSGTTDVTGTLGEVRVITPAEFRLGISYKPLKTTVIDVTYERTFWSRYKRLDFNFEFPALESSTIGQPKDKYWHDTDTIRVGIRHRLNEEFTVMGGIAYDETPIPQRTLGFELPDSNG
ncbi:OmpP1/FadL family transporter, partial [Persephonella sp.]